MKTPFSLIFLLLILLPIWGCSKETETALPESLPSQACVELPPKEIMYLGGAPILQEFTTSGGPNTPSSVDIEISVPLGLVEEGFFAAVYGKNQDGQEIDLLEGTTLSPGENYTIPKEIFGQYESMMLQLAYEWPDCGTLSRRVIDLYTHEDILSAYPTSQEENRDKLIAGRENFLALSVKSDKNAGVTHIPLVQGDFPEITYVDVYDVRIFLETGEEDSLEKALNNGWLTVEKMMAKVKLDVGFGKCVETAQSKNGLTVFTYEYPEFNLRYVYDLYEAPNGEQKLIADVTIYGKESTPPAVSIDRETGK